MCPESGDPITRRPYVGCNRISEHLTTTVENRSLVGLHTCGVDGEFCRNAQRELVRGRKVHIPVQGVGDRRSWWGSGWRFRYLVTTRLHMKTSPCFNRLSRPRYRGRSEESHGPVEVHMSYSWVLFLEGIGVRRGVVMNGSDY